MEEVPYASHIHHDVGRMLLHQFSIQVFVHVLWLSLIRSVYFFTFLPADVVLDLDIASTTAMVAMSTVSVADASTCRTCIGLFMPSKIGPTASALPISCNNL